MAKPIFHAINSAKKFGGDPEDYQAIHCKMDSSKSCYPKMAHRLIFHSTYGHELITELLGKTIVNSDNISISVISICEQHTYEDLGFIPSLSDYSKELAPLKSKNISAKQQASFSAARWGGSPKDYLAIHNKMYAPGDCSASRAIFHSSFGIYLIEELFGVSFQKNDRVIAVRDIAEQHVLRLYGYIPTLSDWLDDIESLWMVGIRKSRLVLVD